MTSSPWAAEMAAGEISRRRGIKATSWTLTLEFKENLQRQENERHISVLLLAPATVSLITAVTKILLQADVLHN